MEQLSDDGRSAERRAIRSLIEEALRRADEACFSSVALRLDQARLAILDLDRRRIANP